MKIVPAVFERHAPGILDLLNDAILHTTWVYDCDPHPESFMREYFAEHAPDRYPVFAAESDDGAFLGFVSCGPYRHYQGYLHAAELSVYVVPSARGTGVGTALMARLEKACRGLGIHTLIGVIDSENLPSIALHRKCGYELAGTVREAGWKFGRWLTIVYYQKIL